MALRLINGVERSRPLWLLICTASLVPAVLSAFTSYINSRFGRGTVDWGAVTFATTLWLAFGALTPIIYILAKRYPLRREWIGRTVAAHLTGALVMCVGWTTIGVLMAHLLNLRPARESLPRYYSSWILTNLPWSVFLYFTVLGCIYAFTYYREARERESQQARLAAQLAEAKLSALRMQLNPHFLFNSLNAITVLVRDQNTRTASRMLELLSGVLRQVLQSEKRQEVTLDEELAFIERYLAIEQVRFSDRLQVRWSIDPAIRNALVPEFILQPLLENAVRHGVAKRSAPGLIEVAARESDGDIVLSVQDNGPGYHAMSDPGVGLSNTRMRLEALFGKTGELRLVGAPRGGTIATVRFPLRRQPDA
ncbi:MAG TPA: histidine kinase [Pyrinomonadaceae bacterium]|nr:histidine kinase [Pyrinomonadaceae bacterium]